MLRVLRDRWRAAAGLALFAVLGGCAGHFLAQREPWRKDAEIACLQSGSVKETGTIVRVEPINGPGMCGADYPFKVAAFGDSALLGYSGELRPPSDVPSAGPQRWPVANDNFVPTPPPARNDPRYVPPQRQSTEPQFSNPARGVNPPQRTDAGNDPFAVNAGARGVPSDPRRTSVYDAPPPVDEEPLYQPQRNGRRSPAQAAPMRAPVAVPLGRNAIAAVGPVEIKPPATLACPIVSALDRWITDAVQPAAQRWFRQPVAEIKQISAYSCRGMNGQPGARISEHAFGNALDIASFTLADGRTITVKNGWRGSPEEQGFLRDVQGAACDSFNTVLAPGSNRFHYDHIHVDLMRRASGYKICNPDQIPGDVVAARAARERGYVLRTEPAATGTLGPYSGKGRTASLKSRPAKPKSKTRNILDDDDWIEDEGPRPD
jgi:hypothetical protein